MFGSSAGAAAVARSTPTRPIRHYVPEFDVLRGVAILMVVYLHAWFSPWQATPHVEKTWVHVTDLVANTAVPAFLFMSAFLLAQDRTADWRGFARRKLSRIGIPALFWMGAILAVRAVREGGLNRRLLEDFAMVNISGQYYYILVLVLFMAGFWFLRHWSARRLGWLASAAFLVNLAMIAWYERNNQSGLMAVLEYRNPAAWIFFYAFGYWVGRRCDSLAWTRRFLWPALAGMGASAAAYVVHGEVYGAYPNSYFGVEVFLFSCAALIAYPALLQLTVQRGSVGRAILRPFEGLSRFAFGIYLVFSPFFVGYVTNATVSGSALNRDYLELMIGLFVVGLVTAAAFVIAADRLFPRLAQLLLGTAPPSVQRSSTRASGAFLLLARNQLAGEGE